MELGEVFARAQPVLVLGGGGRLARAMGAAHPGAILLARPDLDVTRPETIGPALDALMPAVVVNTAAVADVDRCEADPDLAFAVNAAGPGALARVCAARGLPLIHISTDYVFTAEHGPAFTEQDAPNAASVYGRSKAEGERRVLDAGGPTCVARVAWLFGHDQDFLHTMLRRARAGEALRVFDQTGVPTPMGLLSDRLGVLAQMMADKAPTPPILHLCGGPPVTRAGWLGAALDVWSAASSLARPPVEVAPPAALRPRFSALDSSLAAGLFGAPLPWRPAAEAAGREG